MLKILFPLLCLSSFCAQAQEIKSAVYTTSLTSKREIPFEGIDTTFIPVTKEDSAMLFAMKELVKELQSSLASVTIISTVTVFKDSSIIEDEAQQSNLPGVQLQMSSATRVYKNGKLYVDGVESTVEPFEFQSLNKQEEIFGYTCALYESADHSTRIWVTTALPYLVNPGIQAPKNLGAVLKFEKKGEESEAVSIIQKIHKN